MSDQYDRTILKIPLKNVFALEIREQADTVVARILRFADEDQVRDAHVPPLPNVVEANSAPYRRLLTDASR